MKTALATTTEPQPDAEAFCVGQVLAIWSKVARMLLALNAVDLAPNQDSARVTALLRDLEHMRETCREIVSDPQITLALRVLAHQDGMEPSAWLRMKAVDAAMPRRKPPAALDLQLRLKGLNARSLIAKMVERVEIDPETKREVRHELARVTIKNVHGDVASCEAPAFAEALELVMQMAGVRRRDEGAKR